MMKNISLTFKITIAFVIVSMSALVFIYFIFDTLLKERILKSEHEKAMLIAKTIEPLVAMRHYLGLEDEINSLAIQTVQNKDIFALQIMINKKNIFLKPCEGMPEHLHAIYNVKDTITEENIGFIDISYSLENFHNAVEEVRVIMIKSLFLLGLVFFLFALLTRYLLNPLGKIATSVTNYQIGSSLDFSNVREEPETSAIINAFKKMLLNIREYTVLLERYKYAVDESAIVSKTDISGKITYINEEFIRVSGYSRDELIGNDYTIVKHEDTHEKTFQDLCRTIKEKKVWKGVIKNKTKDGDSYYIKLVTVPIFDDRGVTIEYMNVANDITKIIEQQEQILRQTTDHITGLPNRVKLEEDIKSLEEPKLALFSLDNFHIIKEYYGYDIGNKTLINTAQMLQEYLSSYDMKIYKLAAGEFGMLATNNIDKNSFNDRCHDVSKKIDEYIVNIDEHSFNIQATTGITYSKTNTISNASLALRQAIDTRKDFLVFEETDNLIKYYETNIKCTKRLKSAFDEDRIVVYTQPIVDAKTLKTDKYECLVRMIDEDGNVISPFYFLDIAKKSKLYHILTKRVIASSFSVFSQLPDKTFSINLSVEDLTHEETINFLREKINEYNIASRLVLEIIESEGIDNFDTIVPLIAEFKKLGCKISIDDFGTGYSNFAYLMQLNVDYIKIDGSLIKDIDHDINSQIISKTILDFAKQLELKTVAEFIHNDSVMKYTQNMGIDYLQGFYLGEPMPIENLVQKQKADI